jgi:serine/threonine protein kinase
MYKTIRELGKGSFGTVTLVKNDKNEYLACKEITDTIDILVGIRETDALLRVNGLNPFIVGIDSYKLSIHEEKYVIQQYLEYCSEGSLEDLLDKEFKTPDQGIRQPLGGIRQRVEHLRNIAGALSLLQAHGIYHMDLKTENIIYRRANGMCLCDFSNYYLKTDWKTGMEAPIIPLESIMYRPPEVGFMRNSWEGLEKTDVWAFGIVMLETLGSWEFVLEVDRLASEKGARIKDLADKIKIVQTNFVKRNGRRGFKTPFQILFGNLGEHLGDDSFGKTFSDETSSEYEMILSGFYAKEYSNPKNLITALEISKEYFRLRKEVEELSLLEEVYQTVLEGVFHVNPTARISMRELYERLCRCLGSEPEDFTPGVSVSVQEIGLWERIPDPLWRQCFQGFYLYAKDVKICYGKKGSYPLPLNSVVFAKHLAEDVIENLIMGMDKKYFIPTGSEERTQFYNFVLAACVLIASEFMDFIFPVQECVWFEDKLLQDIAPYVKLSSGLLLGKLGTTSPTSSERRIMLEGSYSNFL